VETAKINVEMVGSVNLKKRGIMSEQEDAGKRALRTKQVLSYLIRENRKRVIIADKNIRISVMLPP
jgi:propanediol utilization protein